MEEIIQKLVASSPAAVALIVIVILFLKRQDKTEERAAVIADRVEVAIEQVAVRYDKALENCRSVIVDNTRSNERLIDAVDGLVEAVKRT